MRFTPLPRSFFAVPVRELAPRLLGCHLVHGDVVIRITEVEAYEGGSDPGSHAFRGLTTRNATMFGEAGHLYVYRHMGLHSCCNVVADHPGVGVGCLLRAGEVVAGVDVARARRAAAGVTRRDTDLAQGPGRLTVALGVTWRDDGLDVCGDGPLFVADRHGPAPPISFGPRIGLRPEATEPEDLWLRFWVSDDPTVSAPASTRGARRLPCG